MTDHLANPAGRLMLVLEHCWNLDVNTNVAAAVVSYLGLGPLEWSSEQVFGLAETGALADEIESAVAQAQPTHVPPEDLLEELPQALAVTRMHFMINNTISGMRGYIDRGTIKSLKACSFELDRSTGSPQPEESIKNIREAAQALIDEIEGADDLAPEARIVLLEHAEAVLRGVRLVKVSGAEVLAKRGDELLGRLVRDQRVTQAARKSPKVWARVNVLLTSLNLLATSFHLGVAQLPSDLRTFLQLDANPQVLVVTDLPTHPIVPAIES